MTRRWASLGILAVLIVGCEREVSEGPPAIKFGQDECVHCGMIISDQRAAAASIVVSDGKRRALLFDDIGDLIDYHKQKPDPVATRRYVADFKTRGWIEFESAYFVHAPQVHTPMGSGLLAFAAEADADDAARQHDGRRLDSEQLTALRPQP